MARLRAVQAAMPAETGRHRGLAYALWWPAGDAVPLGGVVILHGAGSCKENHYDFARAAIAPGLAAIAFDQRGHGESEGPLGGEAIDDVVAIAGLLRERLARPDAPLALRGSSLGGYLAILAATPAGANAAVAICPAGAEGLRRALAAGTLNFDADTGALESFLESHALEPAVASLTAALLLLHAQGDEQVPVEHSRELAARMRAPGSRLIEIPGGHHRSIQHDEELQAVSLRFITRAFAAAGGA